jgi:signal transduction protein with GAF and PtsI domain
MNDEMNKLIEKFLELNEKKKEIENELEEIKKDIKLNMKAEELNLYVSDSATVYYSEVKRSNLDKTKLTSFISNEDLEKCYNETTFDKLEVRRKGNEN